MSDYLTETAVYCENDGTYPHVTLSINGIDSKRDRYDRDFLVKDENKKYKVTSINQLCYNPANLKFGVICINRYGDGIFSPIYITFNIKNIIAEYLELIVTSDTFRNYSMRYQQGTDFERMSVSPEDFTRIKIVVDDLSQESISLTAVKLNMKKHVLHHASSEDLMQMINLMNPKYYFPIKGEYRYQYMNAAVGEQAGLEKENILLKLNGDVATFVDGKLTDDKERIEADDVLVDGNKADDIGDLVIKDRELLSKNGIVIVSATIDRKTKKHK